MLFSSVLLSVGLLFYFIGVLSVYGEHQILSLNACRRDLCMKGYYFLCFEFETVPCHSEMQFSEILLLVLLNQIQC
jgi:hypothetical protein